MVAHVSDVHQRRPQLRFRPIQNPGSSVKNHLGKVCDLTSVLVRELRHVHFKRKLDCCLLWVGKGLQLAQTRELATGGGLRLTQPCISAKRSMCVCVWKPLILHVRKGEGSEPHVHLNRMPQDRLVVLLPLFCLWFLMFTAGGFRSSVCRSLSKSS